ncbi:substrate-binding periplasmic protein [Bacterioplanoides sp.]|uniref:substrate-binding periplasmic protein n=1 Tax=Bacterioplanoides sp. TaxID=2066072 RepID=UPI003B5AD940
MNFVKPLFLIGFVLATLNSQARPLYYGSPANAAPFSVHHQGRVEGLCHKLITQFAQLQELSAEALVMPWKRALVAAENGKLDVLCGVYKTQERQQFLSYSEAFAQEYVGLFQSNVRPFPYNNWQSLVQGAGATTIGDSWGGELDRYIEENLNVTRLPDLKQAFRMLSAGRVDYVIATLYQGVDVARKMGQPAEQVVVASRNLNSAGLYLAFSHKSQYAALLPQLNAWLASTEVQRLIRQHIQQFESSQLIAEH